jgi:RNA polymerase sigma-70 factor (ECF subfamily)
VPFSTWLFRIAHNLVVDYLRKGKKRATVLLDESLVSSDSNLQLAAEHRLDVEQLVSATKRLTAAQREVISLRFAGELSVAQVAKVMGKSQGAVKALQHSAVVALRKALSGV